MPAFDRQINKLQTKIQHGEAISRRYAWARLGVALAGVAAAWIAGSTYGAPLAWATLLTALILFTILVILHRKQDGWVETLRICQMLYREKAARLALDWAYIPTPPGLPTELASTPLALDLDLTGPRSLHHLLDTTISLQGSRRLAEWLTTAVPQAEQIRSRQAVVQELSGLPRFRLRLALIFRRLSREPLDGSRLLSWLQTPYPDKQLRWAIPLALLLAGANMVFFILNSAGLMPPLWVFTGLLYTVLYFANRQALEDFLSAVVRLDNELQIFQPLLSFLENFSYPHSPHLKTQCAIFQAQPDSPARRLKRVRWVTALVGLRANQVLGPLLNIFSAWDFWTAGLANRQRRQMTTVLPAWLDAFHDLEALAALGEFATQHPGYTFPSVLPEDKSGRPVFNARQIGHPLLPIDRKVRNDLKIEAIGSLLIVTGSNMAGKSTFIRTIGVNLCLAYAGGPVDAAALETLPFRLYTCIRINDSLGDGFSYFYAEVKRLKGLLDELQAGPDRQPLLYLVDEIFRGTNNRERLAGSRAFVQALIGAAGVGLIATHDLELSALAAEHPLAHNIHFRDDVSQGRLVFDYLLREGPSPTTNALKIMALEGLPIPSAAFNTPEEKS